MDKEMKTEIEKIEGCLAHDIYSITCSNEYSKMDKIVKNYSSSITTLIIKWLEGKRVEVVGNFPLYKSEQIIGRNQLITELIGEVR